MRRRWRGPAGTLALGNGRVDNDCHWSGGSAGVSFPRSGFGNSRISLSIHKDEVPRIPAIMYVTMRSDEGVAEGGVNRRKVAASRYETLRA